MRYKSELSGEKEKLDFLKKQPKNWHDKNKNNTIRWGKNCISQKKKEAQPSQEKKNLKSSWKKPTLSKGKLTTIQRKNFLNGKN